MRFEAIFAAIAAPLIVLAVGVAPDSPCSIKCGNVLRSTPSDDVHCQEASYPTAGKVFKECLTCEMGSTYQSENPKQTDIQWALYNLRYATSYCLFAYPDNKGFSLTGTPCITSTACEPLKDALAFNKLATNGSTFDYCASWKPNQVPKCLACLKPHTDGHFVSNFITILDTACSQQPVAGKTVAFVGDPFSRDHVNASDPNPIPSLSPDYFKEGKFGLGAKVGVAFGGLAFLLFLTGCFVVFNGKRRRRAFLRRMEERHGHKGWTRHVNNTSDMHETPVSQRPLRGWDDSPMSAATEKTFPPYFSPYSSQYNSPVSAVDGPSMQWPEKAQGYNIGVALSPDIETSGHWETSPVKGKDKLDESYEMHEVESDHSGSRTGRMPVQPEPPVLHHPGYGRSSNSPPRQYAFTEDDIRRGRMM